MNRATTNPAGYPGTYQAPQAPSNCSDQPARYLPDNDDACFELKDMQDHYQVSLYMPNQKREDFLVTVNNGQLTVSVFHRQHALAENTPVYMERNYCFNRSLQLPRNAETDFVSAEYRNGMLFLQFPKRYREYGSTRTNVAVY